MPKVRLSIALLVATVSAASAQTPSETSVIRLDPALDALVSPDAKLELVRGDFGFTEGTVWMAEGDLGSLLFSDIRANVIYRMSPDGKTLAVHLERAASDTEMHPWRWGFVQNNGKDPKDPTYEEYPMIGANGLALDREGRLIIATWAGRSLVRVEKNGTRTVLADRFEGKRFGGTNDVVVKKDGAIYFTDTFGGLRLREKDPAKELDFNAVYMWKDGKLTLLIKDIPNTNGLAFSPDEKVLYVNGSRDRYVKAYDVKNDDTLENGRMLIDMNNDPARGIRRPRPQDALHRGAHQHLQDQAQRGGHSGRAVVDPGAGNDVHVRVIARSAPISGLPEMGIIQCTSRASPTCVRRSNLDRRYLRK